MTLEAVAAAIHRVRTVLKRNPGMGLHDDAPAVSTWQHGVRCIAAHANGARVATDMPAELGGTGTDVTPGWLFRAGLASCAATTFASWAAAEGIDLTRLEVKVASRSDARGYVGLAAEDGTPVSAGPCDLTMHVRIAARGCDAAALEALVRRWQQCSPIPQAVMNATPLAMTVQVEDP